jgi:hydroxyacid-oxoacid transhydrogenase
MQRLHVPNGLQDVGYTSGDIPALIAGTLAQERLTKLSPRAVDAESLALIFEKAMRCW